MHPIGTFHRMPPCHRVSLGLIFDNARSVLLAIVNGIDFLPSWMASQAEDTIEVQMMSILPIPILTLNYYKICPLGQQHCTNATYDSID